jgi:DNA sulfur modification protein DndC
MGDIFDEIREHILTLYQKNDRRQWCVLFSGGKDSSLVLTIIWQALLSIPPQKRNRPIWVISSNTRVETPLMTRYLREVIEKIYKQAKTDGLPITATLVEPELKNRFFYKVLGRRTTPPSPKQKGYMWCNDHLKRKPIQKEIMGILSGCPSFGTDPYVSMFILGSREEESARRRINLQKYVLDEGSLFGSHPDYEQVICYYPISAGVE